jgi:hypothetical protein
MKIKFWSGALFLSASFLMEFPAFMRRSESAKHWKTGEVVSRERSASLGNSGQALRGSGQTGSRRYKGDDRADMGHNRVVPLPRETQEKAGGVTEGLVWFDGRAGLGDAAGEQVGLDGDFLVWQEADFSVEGLIAGKSDFDAMLSGADEHAAADAHEFVDAPGKRIIDKDRGSFRSDLQLDLRGDFWKLGAGIFRHDNVQDGFLVRFHGYLLREIGVA